MVGYVPTTLLQIKYMIVVKEKEYARGRNIRKQIN